MEYFDIPRPRDLQKHNPTKMRDDVANNIIGRRHRSTRVADQKLLSQGAISDPLAFL